MASKHLSVYSIPSSLPFLEVLASHLLEETAGDLQTLASYTIFLPTRRACRALMDAFFACAGGRSLLLPAMFALGDSDNGISVQPFTDEPIPSSNPLLLPVMTPLKRLGLLGQRIHANASALPTDHPLYTKDAARAYRLAKDLARFIDEVHLAEASLTDLETLVPSVYAEHWQLTLSFLSLVTEQWPEILQKESCLDPSDHRRRSLHHHAHCWQQSPPATPYIAAGITHTAPAYLTFLSTLAELPQGRVVLAGLDGDLQQTEWERLDASHPQYHLSLLLKALDLSPRQIQALTWPTSAKKEAPQASAARARLVSRALQPPPAFSWAMEEEVAGAALEGWTTIACENPEEEARVVALIMREALETPERTCALITPDRALAQRVAMELKRWDIHIDDSAGVSLNETPPGIFMLLLAEYAFLPFEPVRLLALFKHPLASGGYKTATFRSYARALERFVLRADMPLVNLTSVESALAALARKNPDHQNLCSWFTAVCRIVEPLNDAVKNSRSSFEDILKAHITAAEALAATDEHDGEKHLWKGEAGKRGAEWFAELLQLSHAFVRPSSSNYPSLLKDLMGEIKIRPTHLSHSRLFIWGTIEGRLQKADRIILGGLNEQTWSPAASPDPWLNRPMRESIGLPSLEHSLGLTAHDFTQAFCAPEVFLTRSKRLNGSPAVPCRWILRLETVLQACGMERRLDRGLLWRQWARDLDRPSVTSACQPPLPCPPLEVRPRKLSVTNIATLLTDPYAIYARHILKLEPLKPLMIHPHAGHKGNLIHKALETFICQSGSTVDEKALARLLAIGRETFAPLMHAPLVKSYWWPRFERIAAWVVAQLSLQDMNIQRRLGEVKGSLSLSLPSGPFTLTAVADRIDCRQDGTLEIIDYKTGGLPTKEEIRSGFSCQLPLEAAIALYGTFQGISSRTPKTLSFWRLTGGHPAGAVKPLDEDSRTLADEALEGIRRLLKHFDDPATPYCAQPWPERELYHNPYAHLERLAEWRQGMRRQ